MGTPLEIVILPLLAHLAWKRLQIDTDLLLNITSIADELSSGTNTDDLERPWTPNIGVFSEFSAILGCDTRFKSELRRNHSKHILSGVPTSMTLNDFVPQKCGF